jgi:hypothetical protein
MLQKKYFVGKLEYSGLLLIETLVSYSNTSRRHNTEELDLAICDHCNIREGNRFLPSPCQSSYPWLFNNGSFKFLLRRYAKFFARSSKNEKHYGEISSPLATTEWSSVPFVIEDLYQKLLGPIQPSINRYWG